MIAIQGVTFRGLISSNPEQPGAVDTVVWRYDDTGEHDRCPLAELRDMAAEARRDSESESRTIDERADDLLTARTLEALIVEADAELFANTPSARVTAWAEGKLTPKGNDRDDSK